MRKVITAQQAQRMPNLSIVTHKETGVAYQRQAEEGVAGLWRSTTGSSYWTSLERIADEWVLLWAHPATIRRTS